MTGPRAPIRLALVNDYDLVVMGLAALLEPYRDRIEVVEVDSGLSVLGEVDVILYDTFGQPQGEQLEVERLSRSGRARVVVFSWNLDRALLEASVQRGAAGYLSKAVTAKEMVEALEEIAAGRTVLPGPDLDPSASPEDLTAGQLDDLPAGGAWPGQAARLTARESEIVALITQGLSNQEIAQLSYLSINSVKTYIRTAYRKMGVTRRSQAVLWGIKNGFEPDHVRQVRTP